MIAKPPRRRTTRGRFFFHRTQRDLSRGRRRLDVRGRLRLRAGLGQEPGDREIRLVPGLVVNFAFHGGEAGRIRGQPLEPLRLPCGQHASGLVGDFGRRGSRTPLGTPPWSRSVVRSHGRLVPIQVYFHRGPPPDETSIPVAPHQYLWLG